MKRLMCLELLSAFILFFATVSAGAAEAYISADVGDLYRKALVEGAKLGNEHVLIVYDMDNTLLAMDQDLGSDQWFDWQSSILGDATNPDRVAPDFGALLAVQGKLYALSGMHLTQAEMRGTVADLHQQGFPQIVLSSRGPDVRDATMRELKRNGLTFDWSGAAATVVKTYLPYTLEAPEKNCMSQADVTALKLGAPRAVSMGNGVMMTNGLHKGAMLRSYLCGNTSGITAIIFIDDKVKNTDAVQAAYAGAATEVVTYRYSEEDAKVAAFHASDKQIARSAWQSLKAVLAPVFGN